MLRFGSLFTSILVFLISQTGYGEIISIRHDGEDRTYVTYVPPNIGSTPKSRPLVIGLHGATIDLGQGTPGQTFLGTASLIPKAIQEKFIVACPEGLKYENAYYFNIGNEAEEKTGHTDDVGFIRRVINKMIADYPVIDPSRVYVMGHSNGGMMGYRLAAELPHRIAAIASNSGPMVYTFPPQGPVPIIHIHGLKDRLADFEGAVIDSVTVPPVMDVMNTWRIVNGCTAIPHEFYNESFEMYDEGVLIVDDNGNPILNNVIGVRWESPNGENDIELYTHSEGGHEWRYTNTLGQSATKVFWEFLEAHSNPVR